MEKKGIEIKIQEHRLADYSLEERKYFLYNHGICVACLGEEDIKTLRKYLIDFNFPD